MDWRRYRRLSNSGQLTVESRRRRARNTELKTRPKARRMSECVFCRIASGEFRSEIIYEDDQVIGLMDICPIRPGHAQIIPREHFAYFEELPDAIASRMIHLEQRLSRAMKVLYGVPRVAFLFTGGDHAHAHAHVVPLHEK